MPKPSKPKPPRRWRRRLLWAFAIVIVFLLLSPLLIALGPVRDAIADKAGERLGRRVEIDSAFAFWGKGIDLEGITVHSPDGFDGPLATVKKIHADVDVLALIGGDLSAAVRVVEPHITYRRNAFDRGNAEGVMENVTAADDTPDSDDSTSSTDISIVVIGGRVEAPHAAASGASAIDDIQVTLDLDQTGRTALALRCSARGAARDGGDAAIKLDAALDERGEGPVELDAPPLDLSRIAGVVEGASGLRRLGGLLEISGKGNVLADGTVEGLFQCNVENLTATTETGTQLTLRRMRSRADLRSDQGSTAGNALVALGDLRLRETKGGEDEGREVYREPDVTFTAEGRFDPNAGEARISTAQLNAGNTAVARVTEPLRIETDPAFRMAGKAFARLDLGRLGDLRSLVPQLAALGSGTLDAHIDGRSGTGVDLGATITVTGLRLEPSEIAPDGYSERRLVLAFAGGRDENGLVTVNFDRVEGALLRGALGEGGRPLQLKIDAEGRWGLDGAFDLTCDLGSLSRLLGTEALGLEKGETLWGAVRVKGTAQGDADRMRLAAGIGAGGIRFPPSWGAGTQAGTLQGTFKASTDPAAGRFELTNLRGMGLTISATADLDRSEGAAALANAEVTVDGDLAAAQPYLGAKLGIEPGGRVAGRMRGALTVSDQGGTLRAASRDLAITEFFWQRDAAARPVRQARVALEADVRLARESRPHLLDTLKLTASGLSVDVSGASLVTTPGTEIDGTIRIAGDANELAPALSALLGEGYEDLQGSGPIAGSVTLKGSAAEHARRLTIDGTVNLGAWRTGGMRLQGARVELIRPGAAAPLATTLSCTLNDGKARLGATFTFGSPAMPWRAHLGIDGTDLSTIVISRGLGRYLAYTFPALLPASAQQPVLSGRLVADVTASAPDLGGPALDEALAARGSVAMRQGEVRQSTFFGGGGSSGLARLVTALKVAVPPAGSVLEEVGKSVSFASMDSQFSVANRVVTIQRATLRGRRVNVDMSGRVDFDLRVALDATTTVLGSAGRELARYVPNGVIPARVTGTLDAPLVTPRVDLKGLVGNPIDRIPDIIDEIKKKGPKIPKAPKIPNPFK